MTIEDYIGKKLISSSNELDQELYENIVDDGDSISVTFGSMDYDEDDGDNDWIVETGCVMPPRASQRLDTRLPVL